MLAPNVNAIEIEISKCAERIDGIQHLLRILRHEDWPILARWLREEVDKKMEALLRQDLPEKETTALRAEVWTLRVLIGLPKAMLYELDGLSTKVKGLRDKLVILHNRGRDGAGEALEAANRALDRNPPAQGGQQP